MKPLNNNKCNFVRDYAELNKGTEIPVMFALWCGLSGLSATLGRRLWIDMGTFIVFPNLFVVLVAESGRYRKSTSIGLIKKLLRESEVIPNLIAQKITPEALIEALMTKTDDDEQASQGFVAADELSTFLNKKTYEAGLASLMIQLYDCEDEFEYRTKGRGREILYQTCLGLLGGTTIDWIKNAIPGDAVGGGLTSRINFVYVDELPAPVAVPEFGIEKRTLREKLIRHLIKASTLAGEVKMTSSAWEFYKDNYDTYYRKSELFKDPSLSGYASRRHAHLLKLGIVFSISEHLHEHPTVSVYHLEQAKAVLLESERTMPRVISLLQSSEKGALTERVLLKICQHGGISRSNLLRTFSHRLDSRELAVIIETLIHSRRIEVRTDGKQITLRPL